jgi:hypothetical protein
MYVHRRPRKICAPIHMVFLGKPKHQMGIGVPVFRSEVLLFRHRSMLGDRQFALVERSLGPVAFHDPYEAVLSFDCGFVACLPRTTTSASREIASGAALRAMAISASRSTIRY